MDLHGSVKLYVGAVTGRMGTVPAIAILVTADDTPRPVVFFRVVFAAGEQAVVVRGQVDEDSERGSNTYAGVAYDSRGWEVNWRVRIAGDEETISGDYYQPNDQGKLHLREEP